MAPYEIANAVLYSPGAITTCGHSDRLLEKRWQRLIYKYYVVYKLATEQRELRDRATLGFIRYLSGDPAVLTFNYRG